jgi:hypothetical protein
MENGVGENAITWQDSEDHIHAWSSVDPWVADWWAAQRESRAASIAEQAGQAGVRWPDSPAQEFLTDMWLDRDPRIVAFVEALAEAAESDQDFSDLGAGEIESVLCDDDTGRAFIDEAERAARRSPDFARTLTWMWVGGDVEPSLRARLLALGAIDLTAGEEPPPAQKKGRRPSKRQGKRSRHA